ncbi:DUF2892 domain-containing protein [Neisseriaceae bacterium CLB008]|nr:DUF2892 domain-containing protein [Neisseriaceae bacterium]
MRQNVGCIDRGIRIVVGLALVIAAFSGALGAWAYLGAIPLLAGLLGSCPLYSLAGISTKKGCGTKCG